MFFIAGCTTLGPDYEGIKDTPKTPKDWQKDKNATVDEFVKWWEVFDDEKLDTLIKKAYKQNLDIKTAAIRILQSRAALGISEALIYPQVQKLSGNLASTYKKSHTINSAGLAFDIGWEIDFWGKYARGIEASQANLYLSVASYREILTTVVAEVARNYINYKTAQERIIYAKRNIAIQERVVKMTEVQFNSGNVSELDMQQAKTQLYNTKASLPSIELSKIKAKNALCVLLAISDKEMQSLLQDSNTEKTQNYFHLSNNIIQLNEDTQKFIELKVIPVAKFDPYKKIDASLLERRPDIKMAEFKAMAASAKIGQSEALLYPSFSLFGNVGYNSNDINGEWVSLGDAVGVSVGPAFSWNIFQYGRIKNQIRIADAEFEKSIYGYNKTVLNAIRDVDDALNGYVLSIKQLKQRKKALEANLRAFNLSVIQYNNGLVTYQRLLSTVEKLTTIQDIYAQLKGLTSINAVLLYKSLGGGWQMSLGDAYLSKKTKDSLKSRGVDWGRYLDDDMTTFPKRVVDE
jgi:outer membrane protein TolC